MLQLEPQISEKKGFTAILFSPTNTHVSSTGPSKSPLGVCWPMTLIKTGGLENGGMSSTRSQDVRDGLCGDPGPLVARSPPAWIIHTLLNSDQCSKTSAEMLLSDSDLFLFCASCFGGYFGVRLMKQLTAGWFIPSSQSRRTWLGATPVSSLAPVFAADLPGVIQAVSSLEGFSLKPSPSSASSTFSQPCTASWHAAAAALRWGPVEVEDSLLLRYTNQERQRGSSSLQRSLSLTRPFPVCVVCSSSKAPCFLHLSGIKDTAFKNILLHFLQNCIMKFKLPT